MSPWSVSVIVPTFNHQRYLVDTLKGIEQQDIFDDIKVIVGDDLSTDDSFEIASEFAERHPNVFAFRNESNLGVMKNYASLVNRCETEFIAVLEGDDIWIARDKLRKQLEFLENNPDINGCFCEYYLLMEEDEDFIQRPAWANERFRILSLLDILHGNPIATFSTCCYRTKNFVQAINQLQNYEVYDWATNMLVCGSTGFGFVPGPGVIYRVHKDGLWSGSSSFRQQQAIGKSIEAVTALLPKRYAPYFQDYKYKNTLLNCELV